MRIKTTIKDKNKTDVKNKTKKNKKNKKLYIYIYIIHVFQTHRDKTVIHILERTPSFLGSSLPNPLQTEQYTVSYSNRMFVAPVRGRYCKHFKVLSFSFFSFPCSATLLFKRVLQRKRTTKRKLYILEFQSYSFET